MLQQAVPQSAANAVQAASDSSYNEYTYSDHLAELGMGNSNSSEGGSPSAAPEMDPAAIGRVQGVTAAAKAPVAAKQRGPKAAPADHPYMKARTRSDGCAGAA